MQHRLLLSWVTAPDPLQGIFLFDASMRFVAGLYSRIDADRGVWKLPPERMPLLWVLPA